MTDNAQLQQGSVKNSDLATNGSQKKRLAYIDNLKAFTIILVIIQHVCVSDSGIGEWFYIDHQAL
ncbi:MAG: hypothetical protein KKE11_03060, partial [Gammaproteobacteria bacterium]|nr:hypothetical protein [Gammaproteobacteria bacterium]